MSKSFYIVSKNRMKKLIKIRNRVFNATLDFRE